MYYFLGKSRTTTSQLCFSQKIFISELFIFPHMHLTSWYPDINGSLSKLMFLYNYSQPPSVHILWHYCLIICHHSRKIKPKTCSMFSDHERHQERDPIRLSDRKQHDYSYERLWARGHGVCCVQCGGARRERPRGHQRHLGRARGRNCRKNG